MVPDMFHRHLMSVRLQRPNREEKWKLHTVVYRETMLDMKAV